MKPKLTAILIVMFWFVAIAALYSDASSLSHTKSTSEAWLDGTNPPHAVDTSGKAIPDSSAVQPDKPIILSKHAQDMVDERDIVPEWIEQVLRKSRFEDPRHPGAVRAYAPVAEFGNRMLFFDRSARATGRMPRG